MNKEDILVVYGAQPKEMAKQLLEAAKLDELIGGREKRIGLKPNMVVGNPAGSGATTHPEIAAGVIEYLQSKGFRHIAIIEGSWVGDRTSYAYKVCGYYALADKYGVEIIDTQKDTWKSYDCKGMRIDICDSAMAVDFMINLPVLKGHCQTVVTCALKNNKGCIPNKEKRHFHSMGLHKPIAHLNTRVHNDFILVDAICGDLDFEEGGNPVQMNRMMAMRDPVLCDAYACDLLGHPLEDVPYIRMAESLGVGSADVAKANIIELNKPKAARKIKMSRKVEKLAAKAAPSDACSACYASLIHALGRLDEMGMLKRIKEPICIGQGYKGQTGNIGVGSCTCEFAKSLKGCPPKATDIVDFILNEI